jgi:site-specific recombinase XerC
MTLQSTSLAPHVQAFFTHHLCQHKQASPQTIASYRDTFRLFLTFVKDMTGQEPAALQLSDLDAPIVLQFLDYLEHQRGNTVRSRNMRLAPSGRLSVSWRCVRPRAWRSPHGCWLSPSNGQTKSS